MLAIRLAVNQLYITNMMEHFRFKSGHAIWVPKPIKEYCCSKSFSLKILSKSVITKALGVQNRFKFYALLCVP